MRTVQAILLVLFLGTVAIFAFQNGEYVDMTFLKWSRQVPKTLVIGASYVLGMLTGWTLLGFLRRTIREVSEHRRDQA